MKLYYSQFWPWFLAAFVEKPVNAQSKENKELRKYAERLRPVLRSLKLWFKQLDHHVVDVFISWHGFIQFHCSKVRILSTCTMLPNNLRTCPMDLLIWTWAGGVLPNVINLLHQLLNLRLKLVFEFMVTATTADPQGFTTLWRGRGKISLASSARAMFGSCRVLSLWVESPHFLKTVSPFLWPIAFFLVHLFIFRETNIWWKTTMCDAWKLLVPLISKPRLKTDCGLSGNHPPGMMPSGTEDLVANKLCIKQLSNFGKKGYQYPKPSP